MDKFIDRYRIGSTRLQKWDYRWKGAYFITICSRNRESCFGEIADGKMKLSGIGIIADILWYEIKTHAKNVDLGAFVVMPNHIHGILILNGNNYPANNNVDIESVNDDINVETLHATSLQPNQTLPTKSSLKNEFMSDISPKSESVSTIIRSYKSAVSKHAHRLGLVFVWQERFYDNIIRDEKSLLTISKYIENNPANWIDDRFYMM